MKYFQFLVLIVFGIFFQSCEEDANREWVTIDPIQCMGNSWEQDWLENNNDDFDLYSNLTNSQKLQIFEQYYEN